MHVLVLVDDHGLAATLRVCLEAAGHLIELGGSGSGALRRAGAADYNVVVLGRRSAGRTGSRATRTLRRLAVWTPILLVDGTFASADRVRALEAGADDAFTFGGESEELVARVEALGRRAERPENGWRASRGATPSYPPNGPTTSLTPREQQVLELIANGLTDRRIAAALRIQPRTVRFHVGSTMAKLGAQTRAHAVALGARLGSLSGSGSGSGAAHRSGSGANPDPDELW